MTPSPNQYSKMLLCLNGNYWLQLGIVGAVIDCVLMTSVMGLVKESLSAV